MPATLPTILGAVFVAALSMGASIALAQPSTGIDLSNLTPKTPSQKAASESNGSSNTGSQSPTQKSSAPLGGPFAPGTSSSNASSSANNATASKDSKPATSLLKSPFGNSGRSTTPAAAGGDTSSSSNDVQVKIPKK